MRPLTVKPWSRREATRQTAQTTLVALATNPAPLFGTKIRVAGFGGLRLGEQNVVRAIDVFFDRGYVHVNGECVTPRNADGFRGPVKNHNPHEVPLPKSLMHDELLPRVKELLDLSAKATL